MEIAELLERIIKGEPAALAKAISIVENNSFQKDELLKRIYPYTGKAYVVAFTGAPGAGKSSLVSELIYLFRRENLKVGVIAIDPISPFSGGAILGDRIRMKDHFMDNSVFIRSIGAIDNGCGISKLTREIVHLYDAFGVDIVIIETVGVGQLEVNIINNADTTVVVLTPASGDEIQFIKAGIMEIADIFVLNKADLPGANRAEADISFMLSIGIGKKWHPPVVQTVALKGQGIEKLLEEIRKHRLFSEKEGILREARTKQIEDEILENIESIYKEKLRAKINHSGSLQRELERVINKDIDPLSAAMEVLKSADVEVNITKKES